MIENRLRIVCFIKFADVTTEFQVANQHKIFNTHIIKRSDPTIWFMVPLLFAHQILHHC